MSIETKCEECWPILFFFFFFHKKGKLRSFSIDCLLKQRSVSDSLINQIQFHGTLQHIWAAWSRQKQHDWSHNLVFVFISLIPPVIEHPSHVVTDVNVSPSYFASDSYRRGRTRRSANMNIHLLFSAWFAADVGNTVGLMLDYPTFELGFKQGSACASVARRKGRPTP